MHTILILTISILVTLGTLDTLDTLGTLGTLGTLIIIHYFSSFNFIIRKGYDNTKTN
jgi:hypothetical protein